MTSSTPPPAAGEISTTFDSLYAGGFTLVSGTSTTDLLRPTQSKPSSKASSLASASYIDQRFNTRVYRASAVGDTPVVTSHRRHDYSRRQAFNADMTKFVAPANGGAYYLYSAENFALLDGGSDNASHPGSIGIGTGQPVSQDSDIIWHPTDPNKLWHTDQNGSLTWYEFDVVNHTRTTLFSLTGRLAALGMSTGARAWFQAEGRPSLDGRYWGFSIQNSSFGQVGLLSYDRQTDTILGSITTSNAPNNCGMSCNGGYVLPSWSNGDYRNIADLRDDAIDLTNGTRAYLPDFSAFTHLSSFGQHADAAIDVNGNEVYVSVCFDSSRMSSDGINDGDIYYRRLDGGGSPVILYNIYSGGGGPGYGVHMSGLPSKVRQGWCLISHYGSQTSGGSAWFDELVYAAELKSSSPRRLRIAHHQTRFTGADGYWSEPHATASPDFTRVMMASDFGASDRESYMVGLPSTAILD